MAEKLVSTLEPTSQHSPLNTPHQPKLLAYSIAIPLVSMRQEEVVEGTPETSGEVLRVLKLPFNGHSR